MFREYLGGHSLRAIAVGLNADGSQTRRGNRWDGNAVKEILTIPPTSVGIVWDDNCTGKVPLRAWRRDTPVDSDGGDSDTVVIENNHPAIIDRRDVRRRAAAAAATPACHHATPRWRCVRVHGHVPSAASVAVPMYGLPTGSRYGIGATRHVRRGTCDMNATDQAELLDAVLGAIESRFTNPKTVERLRAIMAKKLTQRTARPSTWTACESDWRSWTATWRRHVATWHWRTATTCDGNTKPWCGNCGRNATGWTHPSRPHRSRVDAPQAELDQRITKAVDMLSRLRASCWRHPCRSNANCCRRCIEKVEVWSRVGGTDGQPTNWNAAWSTCGRTCG